MDVILEFIILFSVTPMLKPLNMSLVESLKTT